VIAGMEMGDKKVPPSEAVERPWASNDKLQFDLTMAHAARVNYWAEQSMQQQQRHVEEEHNQKVRHEEELHKQKMEHENQLFHEKLENNRYTLDRLYSVFTEEAVSLSALLQSMADALGYNLVKKE